jgi:PqqD family protein of HPr-rel-A system
LRLRPGQGLAHREWDEEYLVYNDLSGDCHLLDAGGFAVLQLLQRLPHATIDAIAAALAAQFDDVDAADPASLAQVEQVLAGLVSCDLIEEVA